MTALPVLRIEISPPNCSGLHVIRWIEERDWGPNSLLITTCQPDALPKAEADFDLFGQVPAERRGDAAHAVRHSSQPVEVVLQRFLPAVVAQQSLF